MAGGFIPARFALEGGLPGALPAILTPFSAALLHAGPLHLLLNMVMLVICGRALELALGGWRLFALYLAGAAAAAAMQWAVAPLSPVPMIGASGAISAVVAAYAMLFGQRRVTHADPRIARLLNVLWLAAGWIGIQLLLGWYLGMSGGPSVAVWAHIGGFLAGLVLVRPLLRRPQT